MDSIAGGPVTRVASSPSPGPASSELMLVADAFEVGHAALEVPLRVGDGLVVDHRTDFQQAVVEQEARLQVAKVLFQVLGRVALDGSKELLNGLGWKRDGRGMCAPPAPIVWPMLSVVWSEQQRRIHRAISTRPTTITMNARKNRTARDRPRPRTPHRGCASATGMLSIWRRWCCRLAASSRMKKSSVAGRSRGTAYQAVRRGSDDIFAEANASGTPRITRARWRL